MSDFTELLDDMNSALADAFGEFGELIEEDGIRHRVSVIESRTSGSSSGKSGRSLRKHSANHTGEFSARDLPTAWQNCRLILNGVDYRLTNRMDLDDGNAVFELVKETGDPAADPLSEPLLKL